VKGRGGLFERVMTGQTDPPGGVRLGEFRRATRCSRSAPVAGLGRHPPGRGGLVHDAPRGGRRPGAARRRPHPLAKAALDAAVGMGQGARQRGRVPRGGAAGAVRGLLAGQYDALVTALLALRREKISQDLSPAKLSEVLTASLPSLDEKDVSEIAEGFERLDRRRDELARLTSDLAQVKDLARRQREYARRIVLSAAKGVRTAETERDRVTRSEREARESLASAGEQRERCLADLSASIERSDDLVTEIEALRSLDAYREGAQLQQLQRERERLARDLRLDESSAADRQRDLADELARCEASAAMLEGRRMEPTGRWGAAPPGRSARRRQLVADVAALRTPIRTRRRACFRRGRRPGAGSSPR